MTANTGRADLDATVRVPTFHPGEPVFIVRGQDQLAGNSARDYAHRAFHAGVDRAVVEQVMRRADALDAWSPKKLPDAGHLTADEHKQLLYAFGRRAWRARADCADHRVMLAEERALDALMARLRPIVRALAQAELQRDGSRLWRPLADVYEATDPFAALANLRAMLEARYAEPASPEAA